MSEQLARQIIERCRGLGFAAAGVAPGRESAWSEAMRQWLAAGAHGEMDYMSRDLEVRLDPRRIMEGTRSFLVVADRYARRGDEHPSRLTELDPQGRVARYARGRNYHVVMKRRLHSLADALRVEIPGSDFRTCVDTAPVLERELAVAAGLGWQAKNTMVIHPRLGSFLLLGVVATTLDLTPPTEQWTATDHCGTCTRCIDACPTEAITPYRVDGSRCVSYLTIEHRGVVPLELHRGMGDWMYGCDVCQEVCPHNSAREDDGEAHPAYAPTTAHLGVAAVMGWGRAEREAAFRASPMKRASLSMMKRNAIIVAGNALRAAPNPALLERLRFAAGDDNEPPEVRQTAVQVLASLAA